mmetsp:Transcript_2140/g.5426  ORF Transcript_2140/g.5426 Transcript_2140/m.5426 type:complete len:623 (-) Transcript_2140:65-1933(-)
MVHEDHDGKSAASEGTPSHRQHHGHLNLVQYPLQLGLAYLFLFGYFSRCIFVSLKLPASVGVMLSGLAFSYCFQDGIYQARSDLQELAFFLVLLTAGLDISLDDLKPYTFVLAFLPPTFELLGIALFATVYLQYDLIEGLVLGSTLFAVGDGLVIPKMKEFLNKYPQHPLPFQVFTCVPLEAAYALTLFGIFKGMSHPEAAREVNMDVVAVANIVRILATLLAGSLIGLVAAYGLTNRADRRCCGRPVFSGQAVEAFLVLISAGLMAYGLGAGEGGAEVVPMRFSSGSLFQPELMVIVTASVFSDRVQEEELHKIENILGGVWVFGQVVLFSMLGTRTRLKVFTRIVDVVPVLGVGLLCRMTGVVCALSITRRWRPCIADPDLARQESPETGGSPGSRNSKSRTFSMHDMDDNMRLNSASLAPDVMFCFLSCLPRATIQGALGSVPLMQGFFHASDNRAEVDQFINAAAKLYIVLMAVFGMVSLNSLGPRMLQRSERLAREARGYDKVGETEDSPRGSPEDMFDTAILTQLAIQLDVMPSDLRTGLQELGMTVSINNPSNGRLAGNRKSKHTGATQQFEVFEQALPSSNAMLETSASQSNIMGVTRSDPVHDAHALRPADTW